MEIGGGHSGRCPGKSKFRDQDNFPKSHNIENLNTEKMSWNTIFSNYTDETCSSSEELLLRKRSART